MLFRHIACCVICLLLPSTYNWWNEFEIKFILTVSVSLFSASCFPISERIKFCQKFVLVLDWDMSILFKAEEGILALYTLCSSVMAVKGSSRHCKNLPG